MSKFARQAGYWLGGIARRIQTPTQCGREKNAFIHWIFTIKPELSKASIIPTAQTRKLRFREIDGFIGCG